MRTIDSFINETLNSRQVQKEIELDERIAKTYDKYPDLRKIDVKLLDVRRDSMMMLLDGEITEDEIISDSEKKLIEQRAKFLKDNCIMPEFDKIWAVCEKCNDTGYVERGKFKAVCSCMKEDLSRAYNEAGLADYKNIKPSHLSTDAIKNPTNKRDQAKKKLDAAMSALLNGEPMNSVIYQDGPQTGKTFLSVCVTKILIGCGKNAIYIKLEDLYDKNDYDLEDIRYCDFLIIDDFTSSGTKSYKIASALNRILECRSINNKFTLIVMGESPAEAVSGSEERIAAKLSRLECI